MPIRHLDDVKEYFYLFFNMGKRVAILINSDVACRYGGFVRGFCGPNTVEVLGI